jgi:hypothetical protein
VSLDMAIAYGSSLYGNVYMYVLCNVLKCKCDDIDRYALITYKYLCMYVCMGYREPASLL